MVTDGAAGAPPRSGSRGLGVVHLRSTEVHCACLENCFFEGRGGDVLDDKRVAGRAGDAPTALDVGQAIVNAAHVEVPRVAAAVQPYKVARPWLVRVEPSAKFPARISRRTAAARSSRGTSGNGSASRVRSEIAAKSARVLTLCIGLASALVTVLHPDASALGGDDAANEPRSHNQPVQASPNMTHAGLPTRSLPTVSRLSRNASAG